MGAFSDGDRIYVDVEMSESNPFPFMPMRDGSGWNPRQGTSYPTRLSVDAGRRRPSNYGIETLSRHFAGALPRQDDRYNTKPYSAGFLPTRDPNPDRPHAAYVRFDHANGRTTVFNAGPNTSLAECCFAPKSQERSDERKEYSVAQARDRLANLVHQAERGRPILITRRGKPAAVLISAAAYERTHGRPRRGVGDAILDWRAKHGGVELTDHEIDAWRDRSTGGVPEL